MHLTLLKAKLHRACVTHVELDYEGSCAIDGDLLDQAGVLEYEQVQIYNITNGERLTTYAMRAEPGSRVISINGAAAHRASIGDRVIVCAYAGCSEEEAAGHAPTILHLDEQNRVARIASGVPMQVAS